ncbi:hypothetical protein [Pararhizobium sp.]|uniref:hypothetical protein n=1 Tax=Pararhizobium sp. TaxID=1977563 RepID=UPI003D099583
MSDYACWFCKETIEEHDVKAVYIRVTNLWFVENLQPSQEFQAHSECAKRNLSAGYKFDPDDLMNPQ